MTSFTDRRRPHAIFPRCAAAACVLGAILGTPPPASAIDFEAFATGTPVEGPGVVSGILEIQSTFGQTEIIDGVITSHCFSGAKGIGSAPSAGEQQNDYTFLLSVPIDSFSLRMLDVVFAPSYDADWSSFQAIQGHGLTVHPALIVEVQPGDLVCPVFPDPQTVSFEVETSLVDAEIQIDLATYGPPVFPPDPILVASESLLVVGMEDVGILYSIAIQLSSDTGALLDPGSIVGFNPQPEPPASPDVAFSPPPPGPAQAFSLFARIAGGSGPPPVLTLSFQVLEAGSALPLTYLSQSTGIDGPLVTRGTRLFDAAPNPLSTQTSIRFELERPAHADLSVFDVTGHLVTVLVDGPYGAGVHKAHWNGRASNGARVASGVYLYRLRAGNLTTTKRMVLLK